MMLPQNFASWNPAMRGAYMKGVKAHGEGKPIEACPYNDHRKPSGGLSWSRAFIRAWEDGWRDAAKEAAITEFYVDRANSGQSPLAK